MYSIALFTFPNCHIVVVRSGASESDAVWVQELANTVAFVLLVYVATFVIFLAIALGICCSKVLVLLRFCGSPHTCQAHSSGTHPVFKAGFLFE